jgi:ATP-dependent Clp protease adaptor protein ClpS
MGDPKGDAGTETLTKDKVRVKHPKQYRVILLNDDYTTMDFVISVLQGIFKKSPAEAMQIMLHVHKRGQGVAGIFTKEIAEAKVVLVHERAKEAGYPLRCTMEEE